MSVLRIRSPIIFRAVESLGSVSALARALRITRAAIYQWDEGEVPPKRALEIERVTRGAVTKQQLCPSIFKTSSAAE